MRHPLTPWVLTVYLTFVLAALEVAVVRLRESTEMPGLAAIGVKGVNVICFQRIKGVSVICFHKINHPDSFDYPFD